MKERRHKYGVAKKEDRTLDGITFASKKEMTRYSELVLMMTLGLIRELELQPRFPLVVRDVKIATYVADFRYKEIMQKVGKEIRADKVVIEDVKGFKTPEYKLKKKHAEAQYGITIREV